MFFIQIFFIILSIFITPSAECKKSFSVNEIRLKNGAVIINVDADWGSSTQVVSIFIKNGAALKFDRKTSFPALAFKMLDYRLQRLGKSKGFIVKSEFTWDYSAFTLYFPKGFLQTQSPDIWGAIFTQNEADSMELDNLKTDLERRLKDDLNRRLSKMPMISLMSPNSNIYSLGLYGNEDDLKSIDDKEFNEFLKCYLNPLGSVISLSGLSKQELQLTTKELEKNRPCFRDERFFNESIGSFNLPVKKINYAKSNGSNSILRMGYPSVNCSHKDSFAYDLVQQLISDDRTLASIGSSLYASNNCSAGGGASEIIIGGLKNPKMEEAFDSVFNRMSSLGKNIDDNTLALAKQHVVEKYFNILGKRDGLIFFAGKMRLLYGDQGSMLNYINKIKSVQLQDVRRIFTEITEKNSYCVMIRLEG